MNRIVGDRSSAPPSTIKSIQENTPVVPAVYIPLPPPMPVPLMGRIFSIFSVGFPYSPPPFTNALSSESKVVVLQHNLRASIMSAFTLYNLEKMAVIGCVYTTVLAAIALSTGSVGDVLLGVTGTKH